MKVMIEVRLKPFTVPNFVIAETEARPRQEGVSLAQQYRLSALDPETLERLCEEFTNAVFKKAGKQRPPVSAAP